jgi:hypothetical protein
MSPSPEQRKQIPMRVLEEIMSSGRIAFTRGEPLNNNPYIERDEYFAGLWTAGWYLAKRREEDEMLESGDQRAAYGHEHGPR